MTVKFLNIKIENFKSIENLEIEFHDVTRIYGANESGKTSVADAISWVLIGKNSLGDSTFNIIPINSVGISPTVELKLSIDEKKPTLKRVLKAKIGRDKQFTGEYATECYVNGVKYTQRDFEKWIADNICDPEIFKLIHDVRYFAENISTNGKERTWEARRRLLTGICGIEHDNQLALLDERFKPISERLSEFDDAQQLMTWINGEISDAEKRLNLVNEKIETYDRIGISVDDGNIGERYNKLCCEKEDLEFKKDKLIREYNYEVGEYTSKSHSLGMATVKAGSDVSKIESDLRQAEIALRANKANYEKYGIACPTCGRKFARGFSEQKKAEYDSVNENLTEKIEKLRNELEEAKTVQKSIETDYKKILETPQPKRSTELDEIEAKIIELIGKISAIEQGEKQKEHFEAEKKKAYKERDESSEKLSRLQRDADLTKDFINYKSELVERKVNELFDGVEIRMFKKNKTDGEYRSVCEILHRGVSYENLSYSERFIVSLQIVRAFQKFHNLAFPICVDNSESITINENYDTQMILFAVKDDGCQVCGHPTSRKMFDGLWHCDCGWVGKKELEIC